MMFVFKHKWLITALTVVTMVGGAAAADKVSARTVKPGAPRSGSILSNKVATVEVPQSVFIDDAARDDPFFPGATYRLKTLKPSKVISGGEEILSQLKLTGFGGIGGKRWAMINGVSIYSNEDATVRVGSKAYKIVCIELKERSVVVGIKGATARRELVVED